MQIYDKAKWHLGTGEFPSGLGLDQIYVHTGLYLTWLIDQGLLSEGFAARQGEAIARVRRRELTGPALFRRVDGVLDEGMLSEAGNAFTLTYYLGPYLADYREALAADLPSIYHVEDSWASYQRLKPVIDRRYAEWQALP